MDFDFRMRNGKMADKRLANESGTSGYEEFLGHLRLFKLRKNFESRVFENLNFFRFFQIQTHHLGNHGSERVFRLPTENALCLCGIAEQKVDFSGAEKFGIDGNEDLPGFRVHAGFINSGTLPFDIDAHFFERPVDEVADGVSFAHGDDEIFRLVLLEHEPHGFYVVLGVPPVAFGIEIADFHLIELAEVDLRDGAGNLAGHEILSAKRGFVIEKKAVAREHAVALAVVGDNPETVELSYAVRAAGVERRRFGISGFRHVVADSAEHFGGGSLVEASVLFEAVHADGFEKVQYAHRVGLGGVFRHVEAEADVGLRREVVHFVRLDFGEKLRKSGTVGHVAEVELDVGFAFALKELVDAAGIEKRSAALETVDFVPLIEKEFGKVCAVLAGDSGDEGFFHLRIN